MEGVPPPGATMPGGGGRHAAAESGPPEGVPDGTEGMPLELIEPEPEPEPEPEEFVPFHVQAAVAAAKAQEDDATMAPEQQTDGAEQAEVDAAGKDGVAAAKDSATGTTQLARARSEPDAPVAQQAYALAVGLAYQLAVLLVADWAHSLAVDSIGYAFTYLLLLSVSLNVAFARFPKLRKVDHRLLRGCCQERLGLQKTGDQALRWRNYWKKNRGQIQQSTRTTLWWGVPLLLYLGLRALVGFFQAEGSLGAAVAAMGHSIQGMQDDAYKDMRRSFIRYGVVQWIGYYLWKIWQFVTANEHEMFRMRVNISLNVREQVEGAEGAIRGKYKFKMRTIDECSCQELLPGLSSVLAESMDLCMEAQQRGNDDSDKAEHDAERLKGRLVTVPRKQAKQINDQIVNRLSRLFGTTYLQEDMKQDVEQMSYIYSMTYEHDEDRTDESYGHKLVNKFRVLLMEQNRFIEMTNTRRLQPSSEGVGVDGAAQSPAATFSPTMLSPRQREETLTRKLSITDHNELKWEACQYKCQLCKRQEIEAKQQSDPAYTTPRRGQQQQRPEECNCRSCVCNVVDGPDLWKRAPCGQHNRCYGSDRIRDLMVMRKRLEEEKQLTCKEGEHSAWNVSKFDFASWKRRGESSGGPKKGTWPFRDGDEITVKGENEPAATDAKDAKPIVWIVSFDNDANDLVTARRKFPPSQEQDQEQEQEQESSAAAGGSGGSPSREGERSFARARCDFARGFDFGLTDNDREDPREPLKPQQLKDWANGSITIAGNLFIAVPMAHGTARITRAVSEIGSAPNSPGSSSSGGGGGKLEAATPTRDGPSSGSNARSPRQMAALPRAILTNSLNKDNAQQQAV